MTTIYQIEKEELQEIVTACVRQALADKPKLKEEPLPDQIPIDEAEKITGLKRSTLYKGSWDGSIPCHKRGKRLIYSRKELHLWMESRTVRKTSISHSEAEKLASDIRAKHSGR